MNKHEKISTLITVDDEMSAALIVATLKEQGIRAQATGGYTAGFRAEAPGYVDVVVNANDMERAREILNSMKKSDDPVDWSQVDVGRPDTSN